MRYPDGLPIVCLLEAFDAASTADWSSVFDLLLMGLPISNVSGHHLRWVEAVLIHIAVPGEKVLDTLAIGLNGMTAFPILVQFIQPIDNNLWEHRCNPEYYVALNMALRPVFYGLIIAQTTLFHNTISIIPSCYVALLCA